MRRRAMLAILLVLVGFVSFFTEEQTAVAHTLIVGMNFKAVCSRPYFVRVDDIEIGNFAENIENASLLNDHWLEQTIPRCDGDNSGLGEVLAWSEIRNEIVGIKLKVRVAYEHMRSTHLMANATGWGLPVVFDRHPDIGRPFVIRVNNFSVIDMNVGPQLPRGGDAGVIELVVAGPPEPVRGGLKREGEGSDSDGRKGSYSRSGLVKNLRDLDADEWNKLINGAVFLFGLFGYFAYFVVSGDKAKNSHNEKSAHAKPK